MQGSVDLTAKDQRQPLSGTVLTLQSDWRVFSTFCLVSRNSTDKGLQEKKKKKEKESALPKLLRLVSSAVQRPQDGSSSPPREGKGKNSPPQAAKWKIIFFWQISSSTVLSPCKVVLWLPCLNKAALQFPPCPDAHTLSLLRRFSPHLRAQHSNNSAPYPDQLCSLPAHPESHCAPTSILPFPFLLLLPWAALRYTDCSLLPLWPSKCSGAVNK